jgi:RNA polymerase sigma-70 factor (ECF subfamily)
MGIEMDEIELVKRLQNPATKSQAFGQLVSAYKERIYWHVRRMVSSHEDADDIVQNVFIKIFKGVDRFKSKSKLYTWVYRIATNESISFLEKNKNHKTQSIDKQPEKGSFDAPEAENIMKKLMLALQGLPAKQRAVFNMRYFEEMSYKKMSEILHTSEGALKASYHHATNKIRQYLLEEDKL